MTENERPELPPDLWESQEGGVPAVNPGDLRNVCKLFGDVEARAPGRCAAIGNSVYERVCSPGADVMSVWYRAWVLKEMMPEQLASWRHDGQFDDAVFEVAATFPMQKMKTGVVREGPPFDVEECVKRIGARI